MLQDSDGQNLNDKLLDQSVSHGVSEVGGRGFQW